MKNGDVRPSRPRLPCFSGVLLGSLFVCLGCGDDSAPVQTQDIVSMVAPLESACADGVDNDADGNADCADPDCQSPGGECVPAPLLDRTVATSVAESAEYLYSGDNPLQRSVDAKALDAKRMALLRGRTVDADAKPLSGVRVSVHGHPEYGFTHWASSIKIAKRRGSSATALGRQ